MKTKQRIVSVALLSSFTLITGLVLAADPDYPTNPERSFTTQSPPTAKTRAEVRAELDEYRRNLVTPDGWQDVGGERGDKFAGGKFNGSDSPSLIWTADEHMMASLYYRNTQ
jgi:hypothetical protein